MSNLRRNIRGYFRHRDLFFGVWKTYFLRLFRASLPLMVVPMLMGIWMMAMFYITPMHALVLMVLAWGVTMVLARFYVLDLAALAFYVRHLAFDKPARTPDLSFVSHAGELSSAISDLQSSWGARKIELEAALAESKILFDTLPDVLVMLDENHSVLRANVAAYVLLGEHIIGRDIYEVIPYQVLRNTVHEVISLGEAREIDLSIAKDNRLHIYASRVVKFPVHSTGGIAAIVILHNVTEARHSKQLIKDFVANASHEIRTPLTSLVGLIETLQTSAKDDPEAQTRFLDIMSSQASHMAKLVNDLLSLSKIEMNEATPLTEKILVSEPVRRAVDQLAWSARDKNVSVELEEDVDLAPMIGDADELTQVFTNLLANAIKYGKQGGTVRIRMFNVTRMPKEAQRLAEVKKAVAVEVIDEGEGIPKEHIPRLTERFYRVDKSRSRKIGGTGLGLSIVKHILNHHNGDLIIRSEIGRGSVFAVYFAAL